MTAAHRLAYVAAVLGIDQEMKDPERWLMRQIRSGRIRARKMGRSWYMTDRDIEDALEEFASAPEPQRVLEPTFGLSSASLRRRAS